MRKTILAPLMLILSILCLSIASAAVSLTTTAIDVTATQGDDVTATTSITNNGDEVDLTMSVSSLSTGSATIPASSITLNPTSATLTNGNSIDVKMELDLGTSQAPGTYTGTITVDYDNGSATGSEDVQVTLTVQEGQKGTLTFNDVTAGDDNQEREEYTTKTFTITNDGILDVTNLIVSLVGVDTDYDANISAAATTIPAGDSVDVTVELYVPDDQDAGVKKLGTIKATGNAGSESLSTTKDLNLETENNLRITKVTFDGEQDSDSVKNDDDEFSFDKDEDPRPGESATIEVEFENTFNDNIDIEDIEITIVQDDDLDWDEDEDAGDLKDGDDDSVTFDLDIDRDVDEDDYNIEITITGVDENGATHGETWTVTLPVTIEDDDLKIVDARFSPSYVECGDNSVRLTIDIENVGADDQERGVLQVKNDELDIEEIVRNIEVDEDDEVTETMTIRLPDDIDSGSYLFDIYVYTSSNDEDLTDVESATLTVSCNQQPSTPQEPAEDEDDIEIVVPPTNVVTQPGNVVATATGKEKTLDKESNTYLILLIVIIVLLLVLIIVAAASLGGKKKK